MGIGPVVSIKEALKKAGKTISDMDLIDVNEVCHVILAINMKLT
jgi:acetyl-CoA acyltransferase 2